MAGTFASANSVAQKMAYFSIVVTTDFQDLPNGEQLFEVASQQKAFVFMQLEKELKRLTGDDCRIEDFDMREGSILMSFVAVGVEFFKGDVGQILLDVSRYEALVKSLSLFASQITGVLRAILPLRPGRSSVDVSWQLAPSVVKSMSGGVNSAPLPLDANRLLLFYLVGSHALLMILVIWLVVRHLP
jgi:hypothetical protein